MTKSIHDIELVTVGEMMGILRMGRRRALNLVHSLPLGAVIRSRLSPGGHILVHSWALHRYLNLDKQCPGCGRPWPGDTPNIRDGRFGPLPKEQ